MVSPILMPLYRPDKGGHAAASVKSKKRHLALTPSHQRRQSENAARAKQQGPKAAAEARGALSSQRDDPIRIPARVASKMNPVTHRARQRKATGRAKGSDSARCSQSRPKRIRIRSRDSYGEHAEP